MVESKFAILDITSKLLNWLNESRLSYNYSQSQKESNSKDANQKVKTQYFNDIEIDNGLIKIRITNHHPNYQNYYNRYKNGEIMPLSDSNNISIEFYEKSVKRNRIYNKVKPSEDDDNPQEFTINIFNYMPSKLDKGDLDTIFKSITSFIQTGDKYVDPFAGTPKEAISSAKLSKFEHTQIDKYSNKLLKDMRYNEKHSLYESIMKDVAKTIKHHLNESVLDTLVIDKTQPISKGSFPDSLKRINLKSYYENNLKWHSLYPNDIIIKDDKIGFKFSIYLHGIDNNKIELADYTLLSSNLGWALGFIWMMNEALIESSLNDIGIYFKKSFNIETLLYSYMYHIRMDNKEQVIKQSIQKFIPTFNKVANGNLKDIISFFDKFIKGKQKD